MEGRRLILLVDWDADGRRENHEEMLKTHKEPKNLRRMPAVQGCFENIFLKKKQVAVRVVLRVACALRANEAIRRDQNLRGGKHRTQLSPNA